MGADFFFSSVFACASRKRGIGINRQNEIVAIYCNNSDHAIRLVRGRRTLSRIMAETGRERARGESVVLFRGEVA